MTIKKGKTFAEFCKNHKIAHDSIKWVTLSDKTVKISIDRKDFEDKDGGWNLLSVAIAFALRQLGADEDITIREVSNEIEVIVEK